MAVVVTAIEASSAACPSALRDGMAVAGVGQRVWARGERSHERFNNVVNKQEFPMRPKTEWHSVRVMTLFIVLLVLIVVPFRGSAQAPTTSARLNQNPATTPRLTILENDRVVVDRRVYAPGERTDPPGRSHVENPPRDVLRILVTPGDVEIISTGDKVETGHFEAGHVWWWPKPPATHSFANIGKEPITILGIRLK